MKRLLQMMLVVLMACTAHQALSQAVPIDDTSVTLTSNRVGPADTHLKVNYNKTGSGTTLINQSDESYLRFDFSMFPNTLTGAGIQKATLVLTGGKQHQVVVMPYAGRSVLHNHDRMLK